DLKLSRRRYSRRRSRRLSPNCTYTADKEISQIQRSWNPGKRDSATTGIATMSMRAPDVTSDGTVFPIAWNMLDATKITPDATKFHDTMRRYSLPTASTAGSFEKTPINAWGAIRQRITSNTITAETMYAALRNVS